MDIENAFLDVSLKNRESVLFAENQAVSILFPYLSAEQPNKFRILMPFSQVNLDKTGHTSDTPQC